MSPMQSRTAAAGAEGFSLIEVVVALALLGVVATAALGLITRTLAADVALQHRETAVGLATAAMEQVRVVDPAWTSPQGDASGVRQQQGLVAGRTETAAKAAWNASDFPEKAMTAVTWDSAVTGTSTPVIPVTSGPTQVSGQTFTTTVLIGTCARPRTSASATCTTTFSGDRVLLQRVVVEVRWTPVAGSCPSGGCVYRASALVDPNADATWLRTP